MPLVHFNYQVSGSHIKALKIKYKLKQWQLLNIKEQCSYYIWGKYNSNMSVEAKKRMLTERQESLVNICTGRTLPPHGYESEHKMLAAHEHQQVSSAILDGDRLLIHHVYLIVLPALQLSEYQQVRRENRYFLHISV
jgi:hypothetical protein